MRAGVHRWGLGSSDGSWPQVCWGTRTYVGHTCAVLGFTHLPVCTLSRWVSRTAVPTAEPLYSVTFQQLINEENLRKQEESVQKQEAMRRGGVPARVLGKQQAEGARWGASAGAGEAAGRGGLCPAVELVSPARVVMPALSWWQTLWSTDVLGHLP